MRHHWQKNKMLLKTQCRSAACAPARLLTGLAVMLRLCAGAGANCSLHSLASLFAKLYHRAKGILAVWNQYILFGGRPECIAWMQRGFYFNFYSWLEVSVFICSTAYEWGLDLNAQSSIDSEDWAFFFFLTSHVRVQMILFPKEIRVQGPHLTLTCALFMFSNSCSSQVKAPSWGADVTWIPPNLISLPSWPRCRPPSPWVMRRDTTASTTSPWAVRRSISALSWQYSDPKGQTALLIM